MPEASLVVSAQDRYSTVVRRMRDQTKAFSKDMDQLEKQLYDLNTQKTSLKVDADAAKSETPEYIEYVVRIPKLEQLKMPGVGAGGADRTESA